MSRGADRLKRKMLDEVPNHDPTDPYGAGVIAGYLHLGNQLDLWTAAERARLEELSQPPDTLR